MDNPLNTPRTVLVLSLWAEMQSGGQLAWRGTIRTVDGQRKNFSTLPGLNRILSELTGWQDASTGFTDEPSVTG
jgi:hypothetical protein